MSRAPKEVEIKVGTQIYDSGCLTVIYQYSSNRTKISKRPL